MGVKYKRTSYRDAAHGRGHAPPVIRWRFRRLTLRQRLLVIYIGIGAFALLLLFHHIKAGPGQFEGQPELTGRAVVTYKRAFDEGTPRARYALQVEVELPDGRTCPSLASTDAESWTALAEGQTVGVRYQLNRRGTRVRVLQFELLTEDETPPEEGPAP